MRGGGYGHNLDGIDVDSTEIRADNSSSGRDLLSFVNCGFHSAINWEVIMFQVWSFWGSSYPLRIIPIVVAAVLIIILAVILFAYSGELKFQAVLLKYTNIFLSEN